MTVNGIEESLVSKSALVSRVVEGREVSNSLVKGVDTRLLFPASSCTTFAGIVTRTSPSELPRATSKVKLFGLTLFRLVTTGLPPLAEPVIVMSAGSRSVTDSPKSTVNVMELELVGFVPAADIVGVGCCVSNVIVV